MSQPPAEQSVYSRYLEILGVETAPGRPSLDALGRLTRAHLQAAPFENISKLLDRKRSQIGIPSLETYLDRIQLHGLGGTCYANAIHFSGLLQHLGYDVDLCGAAMSRPDVHLVLIVRCEGHEYLVDVGYGAPLDHPLPRELTAAYEVRLGNETFRLHPMGPARESRLDHMRDGERIHGYCAWPTPRRPAYFQAEIHRSFEPGSTFMHSIRAVRFSEGRSISLANLSLVEATAGQIKKTRLADRAAVVSTLVSRFGMTEGLVVAALEGIELEAAFDPEGSAQA